MRILFDWSVGGVLVLFCQGFFVFFPGGHCFGAARFLGAFKFVFFFPSILTGHDQSDDG